MFCPNVSIIIPVYNGSNYLREAIDSALAQTYKNIEIVVVNDGSTDGGKTEEIALSYGDRIHYFCKENGGVASALNLGIKKMSGEYFSWLSHDDMFSTNRIEEDIRIIMDNPEIRVTYCRLAFIDGKGIFIKEYEYPLHKVTNPYEVMHLGGVNMCTMTIHKSCFDKSGLFNEANRTTQDVQMTLSLSKQFVFYFNDKAITYSREHAERGTNKLREQHSKDLLKLCDFIRSNYTITDFFPDINNASKNQHARAWLWLGDLYYEFGAYGYADDCYRESYSADKNMFSTAFVKYIIGAKSMDNSLFRCLLKLKCSLKCFFKYSTD